MLSEIFILRLEAILRSLNATVPAASEARFVPSSHQLALLAEGVGFEPTRER